MSKIYIAKKKVYELEANVREKGLNSNLSSKLRPIRRIPHANFPNLMLENA
jgi:hypothetical protein